MRLSKRRLEILLPVVLLAAATSAAATWHDATTVGWTPALRIWGSGDATRAIAGLERLAHASDAMLHHSELDQATQKFSDDALEELEDFDLQGFYRLLPPARDGFHELRVLGELRPDRYRVRRGSAAKPFAVTVDGNRHALFDMEQSLQVKPVHGGEGEYDSYLVRSRLGFGAGELRTEDLVTGAIEIARMVESADPREGASGPVSASEHAVARVHALHPRLGPEDVQTLAVAFDAFPRLFERLARVGEIEDIRAPTDERGFQRVQLKMHAVPKRMQREYPALAKYLEDLDDVATVHLTWADTQGRALAKLYLDTRTLTARTESYLANGKLLPFTSTKVFVDEPVDPQGANLARSTVRLDVRVDLLGIVLKLRGIRVDVRYEHGSGAVRMSSSMTHVPARIDVEGAALGFLTPRLIDAFIPGDIQGLAMDFFRLAATGNEGQGVRMSVSLANVASGREAVVDLRAELEALDNRLVKMGVRMLNDRVIPDDSVTQAGKAFLSDVHAAFSADLTRFEQRLQRL